MHTTLFTTGNSLFVVRPKLGRADFSRRTEKKNARQKDSLLYIFPLMHDKHFFTHWTLPSFTTVSSCVAFALR
jgi:hypothetical protein